MSKSLPERIEHLQRLSNTPVDWEPLRLAIRPELQGKYIEKAQLAAQAGLWDAAVLYFWNETMNDLRRKVVAYGIEYFPTAQGKPLNDVESLREYINDYSLIEGCYQLGIISKEAWFYLQRCREMRNYDSAAHLSDSQLDPIEAINFIKNCVKYVLGHEPPSPGFSIRDFFNRLRDDDVSDFEREVEVALRDQASQIRQAILNRLFTEYIDVNCSSLLKSNLEVVAPIAWKLSNEDSRLEIGQRYVKARTGSSAEAAILAFNFFKLVDGIAIIPEAYRRPIYEKQANELLKVHFERDNFYKEPSVAKSLAELGLHVRMYLPTLRQST